jgi:flagellar assembly protein FliH
MRAVVVSPVPRQLLRNSPASAPAAPAASAPAPPAAPMAPAQATRPVAPVAAAPVPTRPVADPDALRAREALAAELAETRRATLQQLAAMRAEAERRGYAAGEQRGESAARAALQSGVERAALLATRLAEARTSVIGDAEEAAIELAFGAVCRIMGEFAASRDAVVAAVRAGAAAMREHGQVCIRLHPLDLEMLEQGGARSGTELRYCADSAVDLGGCLVESSAGTLDARLETQLERLRATLVGVRAARRQKEDPA